MNPTLLYITTEDRAKLCLLLRAATDPMRYPALHRLRSELDRAIVVDPTAIASTVVTMGSRVALEDLSTGEVDEYTLVFPEHANVDARRLSVLAPIGTAILGYTQGDEVSWATPGGTRRIKLRQVVQPARSPAPTGFALPVALPSTS